MLNAFQFVGEMHFLKRLAPVALLLSFATQQESSHSLQTPFLY